MKYFLTTYQPKPGNQLVLENVTSAKTRHICGYGNGVTFSSSGLNWNHSSSSTVNILQYSEPTIVNYLF
jgi:hypothetical protein